jgi:hypothetical protein
MKPSVTKLIDILNKPALMQWANKIGLNGINLDDFRRKKMLEGFNLHEQIDRFVKTGECFKSQKDENAFLDFVKDKKIISTEVNIETEYFIGRYDIKLKYNDLIYLCDFKKDHKKIYFENKLQLVAYRMAEYCDRIAIISIPDFKIIPISIVDYKPYEDILINLSNIYNIRSILLE